jgi:hypothetical protein
MTNTSSTHQHPRQENKAHTLSPDSSVSGLMQGLEGPVTVCCTNTGKFVGAEGQSGPRNWVGPVESSNPYLSQHRRIPRWCVRPPSGGPQGGKSVQTLVQHNLQTTPPPWLHPSLVCRELEVTL